MMGAVWMRKLETSVKQNNIIKMGKYVELEVLFNKISALSHA